MTSAFVETTVLTDYLLKRDGSEKRASAAFEAFTEVVVPQFAWKEFKRGPLGNFVWAFNKLVETGSLTETVAALQRMSRTPRRYLTSTAIQAVHTFLKNFESISFAELEKKYGTTKTNGGAMLTDAFRLDIKRTILSSWKKRNTLHGGAGMKLPCYPDEGLWLNKERIETSPNDCPEGAACCLKQPLVKKDSAVLRVREVLMKATKDEQVRRRQVLKQVQKRPKDRMSSDECRDFGDAYFVLFCPKGATILTTNLGDIQPMADALAIPVQRP